MTPEELEQISEDERAAQGQFQHRVNVCVAAGWRGKGLGQAVVRLLLEHPLMRDVDRVRLNTRDAQGLYERFGFVETLKETRTPPSAEMVLRRR